MGTKNMKPGFRKLVRTLRENAEVGLSDSNALVSTANSNPTPAAIQSAIIVAMRDLTTLADDTVWITEHETMFDRLATLYGIAGGDENVLAGIWPEYF